MTDQATTIKETPDEHINTTEDRLSAVIHSLACDEDNHADLRRLVKVLEHCESTQAPLSDVVEAVDYYWRSGEMPDRCKVATRTRMKSGEAGEVESRRIEWLSLWS